MSVLKEYNGTTWETVGLENPVLTGATTTSLTGILKGNTGNVTVATPSVDYDLPHSNRAQLDLIGGTNIAPTLDGKDWPVSTTMALAGVTNSTHNSVSKTTPVDADELPIVDSAASNILKKLTWANLKTTLSSYFLPLSGGSMTGTITNTATIPIL